MPLLLGTEVYMGYQVYLGRWKIHYEQNEPKFVHSSIGELW